MTLLIWAISALASYLLGSIPTGYLMARAKGIDIRSLGSGNIGATNVFRVLGKGPGALTLAIDCLKGLAAVRLVPPLVTHGFGTQPVGALPVLCALCAILGHNYTCWLKFKGGKGIATSAGALLGLAPLATLVCVVVWLVVFGVGRYVSLASIAAALALPIAVYCTKRPTPHAAANEGNAVLFSLSIVLCLLALWKHRSNIQRLWNGTEHRFTRKPGTEARKG